jgi:hypothetical protein
MLESLAIVLGAIGGAMGLGLLVEELIRRWPT